MNRALRIASIVAALVATGLAGAQDFQQGVAAAARGSSIPPAGGLRPVTDLRDLG